MNIINKIVNIFTTTKLTSYPPQTFTYFFPAPKQSLSGYREKNFDKTVKEFFDRGYEVIDFKTQAINSDQAQGLWVIFLVRPLNKQAAKFNASSFGANVIKGQNHTPDQDTIDLDIDPDKQVSTQFELYKDENDNLGTKG